MSSSVIYKDWDGVTNAHKPPHGDTLTVEIAVPDNPYLLNPSKITYSPLVVRTIDRFREQYDSELVWSTTWNFQHAVLLVPEHVGGLANGRVLEAKLNEAAVDNREWTKWKAEAIIADQLLNPRPFVWIDDNAHTHWGAHVKESTSAPSLFISTESEVGLTLDELVTVESFLFEFSK